MKTLLKVFALLMPLSLVACNKNVTLENALGMITSPSTNPSEGAAPTPGTLSAWTVAGNHVEIRWTAATDAVTPSANLEYKVVMSQDPTLIESVADANAYTAGLVVDWTAGLTRKDVTGLTGNTTYYFVVLVRNAAHKMAKYNNTGEHTIADDTSPNVGTFNTLNSYCKGLVSLKWTASSDDTTSASNLKYKVVRSDSNNINTVESAETNGTLVMDWTANTTSALIKGLTVGSTYYFNVLVMDDAWNVSSYTSGSKTVSGEALFINFQADGIYRVPLTTSPVATRIIQDGFASRGVAVDDNCNIYVGGNSAVRKYDANLTYVGSSATMSSWLSAVGLAGNYLIAGDISKKVSTFALSDITTQVSTMTVQGYPLDFGYSSAGGKIYYATDDGAHFVNVMDFNSSTGALSNEAAVTLSAIPGDAYRTALTFTAAGKMIIGFSQNFGATTPYTVGVYDLTSGTNLTQTVQSNTGKEAGNGIAVDSDGNIYTYDRTDGTIVKTDAAGNVLASPYATTQSYGWGMTIK